MPMQKNRVRSAIKLWRCLFSSGLLLVTQPAFTQPIIRIEGIVHNGAKNPLPYANISVKNFSIGTISNEEGMFEFFVPFIHTDDTLVISYLGYSSFKARISDLRSPLILYLEESPTILNEITISSDGAKRLVQEAMESIPKIYPVEPYLMEGFHRSWEKLQFEDSIAYPGTLIEAAVTIYDAGYTQRSRRKNEEIYINEIRRTAMMNGWVYNGNLLQQLLHQNMLRHNNASILFIKSFLSFPIEYDYEWNGSTTIEDEDVSVIKVSVTKGKIDSAYYILYISDRDKAILQYDLIGGTEEIDYTKQWHTENIYATFKFQRLNNKIYLKYAMVQYTIKKIDVINKRVLRTEDYFRELLINALTTKEVDEKRKALKLLSKPHSLASQAKPYNPSFWENYNVILENPIDHEIILFFEKEGILMKQFNQPYKNKNR